MYFPIHEFTAQSFFWGAFMFLGLAKLLSTACLLLMGDYRSENHSPLRQFMKITSKVTPSLVVLSAAGMEFVEGHRLKAGAWAVVAVLVAFFAFYMVKLRKQRRFFGAADLLLRYISPRQVKTVFMVVLSVILFFLLRAHPGFTAR